MAARGEQGGHICNFFNQSIDKRIVHGGATGEHGHVDEGGVHQFNVEKWCNGWAGVPEQHLCPLAPKTLRAATVGQARSEDC